MPRQLAIIMMRNRVQAMLPTLRRLTTTIMPKMQQRTPLSRTQKMKPRPRPGTIIMPSKTKQEMRKMPKILRMRMMLRLWAVVLQTQAMPKMRTMLKKMRPTLRLETTITTLKKIRKMPKKMKQPTPQALRMRRPREMRRVPTPLGAMAAG